MNFPIDIVQQRCDGPLGFVFIEFAGISRDARRLSDLVNSQRMSQAFARSIATILGIIPHGGLLSWGIRNVHHQRENHRLPAPG